MNCRFCGWDVDRIEKRPDCTTAGSAETCGLNWENVRKYALRNKSETVPKIVRSIRHQGPDGKGDCSERLEEVLR